MQVVTVFFCTNANHYADIFKSDYTFIVNKPQDVNSYLSLLIDTNLQSHLHIDVLFPRNFGQSPKFEQLS